MHRGHVGQPSPDWSAAPRHRWPRSRYWIRVVRWPSRSRTGRSGGRSRGSGRGRTVFGRAYLPDGTRGRGVVRCDRTHSNLNHLTARAPATPPRAATRRCRIRRNSRPSPDWSFGQRTDGTQRAAQRTASGTPESMMVRLVPIRTNHREVCQRQHDLGFERAAEQQAERGERHGAQRDDHRPQGESGDLGRQPRASPMAPRITACNATTTATAMDLPAMMPQRGIGGRRAFSGRRTGGRNPPRWPGR